MYQVRLNIFSSLFLLLINILLWAIKNVWYPGPKVTFPVWGVVSWCANWEATGRSSCSEVVHRAPSRRQSGTLSSFVREAPELLLLLLLVFFWSGWCPDFRCWSSWRRRVPPLTWTPRMSCARRAATPTACSASPWPCTGSYNQRIKHCERWTFFLLHDTTAWTVVMWSRRQESVGDGARRYFRDLSQA